MSILVTGGAGYIGSHTCVELLNAGYEVVVIDNLINSSEKSLERVEALTGKKVKFYKGDILDRTVLNEIFENEEIDSCIHFAGLKAVGESVAKPWEYYNNNITGTLTLVDVMKAHGCKNIIFSSSAISLKVSIISIDVSAPTSAIISASSSSSKSSSSTVLNMENTLSILSFIAVLVLVRPAFNLSKKAIIFYLLPVQLRQYSTITA